MIDHLGEIDAQLTGRTYRRVRYDLAAESLGAASGRLLEYCDAVHFEAEHSQQEQNPLNRLIHKEAEIRSLKALRYVAELPADERRILSLRFEEGLSAQEIADRLGISSRRRVFTILDRIVRKLRRRHRAGEKNRDNSGNADASAVSPDITSSQSPEPRNDEDHPDHPDQSVAK
jgi:RNA polymerase sigma factor (sigma-70 family)